MAKKRKSRKKLKLPRKLTKSAAMRKARTMYRTALSEWSHNAIEAAAGKCAVCGVGDQVKLNPDGTQRMSKIKTKLDPVSGQHVPVSKRKPMAVVARLNSHHILPKEIYVSLALDPMNAIVLCPENHKNGPFSAHKNPLWFVAWLQQHRPEQYRWALANMSDPCSFARLSKTAVTEEIAAGLLADNAAAIAAELEKQLQIPRPKGRGLQMR